MCHVYTYLSYTTLDHKWAVTISRALRTHSSKQQAIKSVGLLFRLVVMALRVGVNTSFSNHSVVTASSYVMRTVGGNQLLGAFAREPASNSLAF